MISVIIPTYNREKTIERAVRSILNQTYKEFELIIVDDGSTDGTKTVLDRMSDCRIKYVHQINAGACAARNRGIETSSGEYIAFFDSDDECRPDRLEKQLHAIEEHNCDMVCGRYCIHKPDGSEQIGPELPTGFINDLNRVYGVGANTFFAKACVFKEFHFDPDMPRWQDLELLMRITRKYSVFLDNNVLIDYYQQADSITGNPQKCIDAFDRIIEKNPDIPTDGKKLYSEMLTERIKSKNALGIKDLTEDYKKRYFADRTFKNAMWLFAAEMHCDDLLRKLNK